MCIFDQQVDASPIPFDCPTHSSPLEVIAGQWLAGKRQPLTDKLFYCIKLKRSRAQHLLWLLLKAGVSATSVLSVQEELPG
jgi:hypothetical protein